MNHKIKYSLFFLLLSIGCGQLPSVYDRALDRDINNVQITDRDVLSYADDVRDMFAKRMKVAGTIRRVSTSGALISSSLGYGIPSGIMSGVSSAILSMQGIWKEGERGVIFTQGVGWIDMAVAEYTQDLAKQDLAVRQHNISKAGANLFVKVSTAVTVVNKVLAWQTPNLKELEVVEGVNKEQ